MQALTIPKTGGLELLELREMPLPEPDSPDAVRVRLRAAAINHLDLFVVRGLPGVAPVFPHIVGSDGAGIVDAIGPRVTRFKPGDQVMINPGISCTTCSVCRAGEQPLCRHFQVLGEHLPGTIAEFIVVPERNLALIDGPAQWPKAAAFPLATLTAWRMLVSRAKLLPGETILIWGAGGGVAQAAIQIAKLAGARIIATSRNDAKLEIAKRLGADLTLRSDLGDIARQVRDLTGDGVDVVLDSVGQETWPASLKALRPMGRLVTCGATSGPQVALDLRKLFWFQYNILGSTMGNDAEFKAISELFGRGKLQPVIDRVVPLSEAPSAFSLMADGQATGKIVIEVTT